LLTPTDEFRFAEVENLNQWKNPGYEQVKLFSPITLEVLCLIFQASTYYNKDAIFNDKLVSMFQKTLGMVQNILQDTVGFELKTENIVNEMYASRLKEIVVKPIPFISRNGDVDETISKALSSLFDISTAFTLRDSADAHILQLAWFELHFAILHKMPLGMCQFCGSAYRMDGLSGRGKFVKRTCGSDECKKKLRKQWDNRKREENPELLREKDRIRQQRRRMKKNVLELHEKGMSIEEIAKAHKLEVSQIQIWLKNREE